MVSHLVVSELQHGELRVDGLEGLAQRRVEGGDRAVALLHLVHDAAVGHRDLDLEGREVRDEERGEG